jgi:hypothetical protein
MFRSTVREGCREAELQGGCGMLAVEVMEGAWLFVVQPAEPTQLADPADQR